MPKETIKCSVCESEVPSDVNFCYNCGSQIFTGTEEEPKKKAKKKK